MSKTKKIKLVLVTQVNSPETLEVYNRFKKADWVESIHVIFHRPKNSIKKRLKTQLTFVKSNGLIWIPYRAWVFLRDNFIDKATNVDSGKERLLDGLPETNISFVGLINSKKTAQLVKDLNCELGIVFGAKILKERIFSVPKLGMINIHQGLIPEYRGMPPAFWELYNEEKETGISIHKVVTKLDAGEVYFQGKVPITDEDNLSSLETKLDRLSLDNIVETARKVAFGEQKALDLPAPSKPHYLRPTVMERWKVAKKGRCRW